MEWSVVPPSFRAREKSNRLAHNEGDFLQVEENRAVCLPREEILQPLGMFTIHFTAQTEHGSFRTP